MKIGQIRNLIEGMADDDEMFVAIYDVEEANEHIENNYWDGEELTVAHLSKEEWSCIIMEMNQDESVWTELSESFSYYIEKTLNQRKGKNDNSERVNQDALSN